MRKGVGTCWVPWKEKKQAMSEPLFLFFLTPPQPQVSTVGKINQMEAADQCKSGHVSLLKTVQWLPAVLRIKSKLLNKTVKALMIWPPKLTSSASSATLLLGHTNPYSPKPIHTLHLASQIYTFVTVNCCQLLEPIIPLSLVLGTCCSLWKPPSTFSLG